MSTKVLLPLSVFLLSPAASEEGVKLRVSTLGYEDAQRVPAIGKRRFWGVSKR